MTTPLHTIEPELQGPTPRAVRYTHGTQKVRFWLWLLFVGVMGLSVRAGWNDQEQLRALTTQGRTVTGHITAHHVSYSKTPVYLLDYTFDVDGMVISDNEDVSHWDYDRTPDDDPVTITYLPGSPQVHRVGTVNSRWIHGSGVIWLIGGTLAFLILGGITAKVESYYRGAYRLLRSGQAVAGIVTERKEKTAQGKYGPLTTYTLCYRFPTPAGEHTGQDIVDQMLYAQSLPGTLLTVLYDDAKPKRNRLYRIITEARLAHDQSTPNH